MLQSVLIISSSGLVMFSKHFSSSSVDRIFGALLRTIGELSLATTGGNLLYCEFTSTAVYIAQHPEFPLYAAVFFDREPQKSVAVEFGRVIASTILSAFVDDYSLEVSGGAYGHVLAQFTAFGFRIPALIRDAAKAVLQQCK